MINDFVIAKNDSVRDGCVVIGGCSSTAFCNSILESKEIYFDIFFLSEFGHKVLTLPSPSGGFSDGTKAPLTSSVTFAAFGIFDLFHVMRTR